jgi:hypothetical protein
MSQILAQAIDESASIQDIRGRSDSIKQSVDVLGAVIEKKLGGSDEPVVVTDLE